MIRNAFGPSGRPRGIAGLSLFFWFGHVMAGLACAALAFPRSGLEVLWRLNPGARDGLTALGGWAVALMGLVSVSCLLAGIGLWRGQEWGRRLALVILSINLLGDSGNAVLRGDARTLIGLPIGGALVAYLVFVRRQFRANDGGE
jgi:hypothetical protein